MKKFIFLCSLFSVTFLLINSGYGQFVAPPKTYYFRGEVVSFTEHFVSVREKGEDEKLETFIIDDATKIEGEISKGTQVEIVYKRKKEAIRGWMKLATEIKVKEERK